MNTCFQNSVKNITTWSGTNRNGKKYYNQLDYIACAYRQRRFVKNCRSYVCNSFETDHRMVILDFCLPNIVWRKMNNEAKAVKLNIEKLKEDPILREKYVTEVNSDDVLQNKNWSEVAKHVLQKAEEVVGFVPKKVVKNDNFADDPVVRKLSEDQKRAKFRLDRARPIHKSRIKSKIG